MNNYLPCYPPTPLLKFCLISAYCFSVSAPGDLPPPPPPHDLLHLLPHSSVSVLSYKQRYVEEYPEMDRSVVTLLYGHLYTCIDI